MADEAVACNPQIEECEDVVYWNNTIELDYDTPNMIVGLTSLANFVIPVILYRFWFNTERTAAEQAAYNDQSKYQWGWLLAYEGAKYIWGPPAIFWLGSRLVGGTGWSLLLLIWWTTF